MEHPLKCAHPVLQVHFEQALLDYGGCVVEREEVGKIVGVALGARKHSVGVQPGDLANRLGQQMVHFANHLITPCQFAPGKALGMTVAADPDHLVTLMVEIFLGEARHIGRLHHVEPSGRVALRVQDAERL